MSTQGVTEKLCRFAVETGYDSLPKKAVEIAKERILETVGVALAGCQEPAGAGKKVIELVKEMGGMPTCTVIGGGFKTYSPNAALANGTSAHTLDYDDTMLPLCHFSSPLVASVLASAEETKASGKKALEGYILGFEVGARIGRGLGLAYFKRGYHPVGLWACLGTTVASAKILNLTVDQMRMAMAIVASAASGSRRAFGTNTKPLLAGYSARNGIIAAMLAKKGFTGHKDILDEDLAARPGSSMVFSYPRMVCGEGAYDLTAMTEGLGGPLQLVTVPIVTKWRPGNMTPGTFIDLMLDMMQKYHFTADQVERVECGVTPWALEISVFHDPQSGDEARYSIEYGVAAALLDGKVHIEQHREERVHRADVRNMMKKVHLYELTTGIPPDTSAVKLFGLIKMNVKLKDGRECAGERDKVKGDPSVPLLRQDLVAKYKDCAQRVLADAQVEKSIELLENFEELADVGELMGILMGKA